MDNNKLKNIIIVISIIFISSIIILSFSNSIYLDTSQQHEYFIKHKLFFYPITNRGSPNSTGWPFSIRIFLIIPS